MYWRLILALGLAYALRAIARRFRPEGSLWE
jgi:hypothetical protein